MKYICIKIIKKVIPWLSFAMLLFIYTLVQASPDFEKGFFIWSLGILGSFLWYFILKCSLNSLCSNKKNIYHFHFFSVFAAINILYVLFILLFSKSGNGWGGTFWFPLEILSSFSSVIFFLLNFLGYSFGASGFIGYGVFGTLLWILIDYCFQTRK